MKYIGDHWYFYLGRDGFWIALSIWAIDIEFHIALDIEGLRV